MKALHRLKINIWMTGILFILTACSSHERSGDFAHSVFQTIGATSIREYLGDLDILIETYRVKLNKRNPQAYSRTSETRIAQEILEMGNNLRLPLIVTVEKPVYKAYLEKAFDQRNTPYIATNLFYYQLKNNPRYIELLRKMNLPIDDKN